jgi:hypothetical protein
VFGFFWGHYLACSDSQHIETIALVFSIYLLPSHDFIICLEPLNSKERKFSGLIPISLEPEILGSSGFHQYVLYHQKHRGRRGF